MTRFVGSLEELSDHELTQYIECWLDSAEEYRERRRRVARDHPDAYRLGYSGWWCSKNASRGLAEQARRVDRRAQEEER